MPLLNFAEMSIGNLNLFPLGYEPLCIAVHNMLKNLVAVLLHCWLWCLCFYVSPARGADDDLYKFDPSKRIPLLTEQNWSEWSWRIAAAFAAMGVATNVLWSAQKQADLVVPSSVLQTSEVEELRKKVAAKRALRDIGLESEQKKAEDEYQQAVESLEIKKKTLVAQYKDSVTKDPFEIGAGDATKQERVRTSCFQLIVRTVSPELGFLVMNYTAANVSECWTAIRDYFQVNTRGVRNQMKVGFYTMVMEPKQRLAEFKNRIIFASKQLNCMTPKPVITDDDQTTVLMTGVRKHHSDVFCTTLDVLEQSTEEITFEETYKRMIPAARRAETSNLPTTESGLVGREMEKKSTRGGSVSSRLSCRDYARGKCRFGDRCKFSHDQSKKYCTFCKKATNHTEDRCFKKKKQQQNEKKDLRALAAQVEKLQSKLKSTSRGRREKAKVAFEDSDYETASEYETAFMATEKLANDNFFVCLFDILKSAVVACFLFCTLLKRNASGKNNREKRRIGKFEDTSQSKSSMNSRQSKLQSKYLQRKYRPMKMHEFASENLKQNQHGAVCACKPGFRGEGTDSMCKTSTAHSQHVFDTYRKVHTVPQTQRKTSLATSNPQKFSKKKWEKCRSSSYKRSRQQSRKRSGNNTRNDSRHRKNNANVDSNNVEWAYLTDTRVDRFRWCDALNAVFGYAIIQSLICLLFWGSTIVELMLSGGGLLTFTLFATELVFLKCGGYCYATADGETSEGQTALDTGATSHYFNSMDDFIPSSVKKCSVAIRVAGGGVIYATHRGTVKLKVRLPSGCVVVRKLPNSYYVPGLGHNLISLRRLDEQGLQTYMKDGKMTVLDRNNKYVFLEGTLRDGLYRLSVPETSGEANLADNTGSLPEIDLWHRRLGHAAGVYLKSFITGKKTSQTLSYCDACVKAKSHRRPVRQVKKIKSNVKNALSMVVSDLCGPMRTQSMSGKLYFATIIDVATRFIFVFMLRKKSDFLSVLDTWLNFIRTQTGRVPKKFHADGGTEYVNKDVEQLLEKNGVKFSTTAPYSPHQNAVAERMNRTLLESARAMMVQACAPKNFWAEAVMYAAYLRNRTPHKKLDMEPPFKRFFSLGEQGDRYRHVRIWGCRAWLHIGKRNAGKIAARAIECVFIGVDSLKKGYRVYRLDTGAVCVSRDVVFDESVFPLADVREKSDDAADDSSVSLNINISGGVDETKSGSSVPASACQRGTVDAEQNQVRRELRRNPAPSNQALRNIAGDAADVAVDDDMPDLVEDSDSESDSDVEGDSMNYHMHVDGKSDCDTGSDDDITPSVYFARKQRAKRFKFKKKKVSSDPEEPSTRKQMLSMPKHLQERWKAAEREELNAIEDTGVWKEVPESDMEEGRKPLTARWVYKIKRQIDHSVERFKARLTVRGCNQVFGVDYEEVFSAVAQLKSFRLLVALSVVFRWEITQIDIKNAFLHGELKDTVYMQHPDGYPGTPGTVLKLKKALYGLVQSSRVFFEHLMAILTKVGFKQNGADTCVLYHEEWKVFLCVVVDDVAIFTANRDAREKVVQVLKAEVAVKDLGALIRYVNVQLERKGNKLFLHQRSYVESVVKKFGMDECKPAPTPAASPAISKKQCPQTDEEKNDVADAPYRSMVGSLWYAANGTRPDIVYATNVCSQFSTNYGLPHFRALKRIIRYLRGTVSRGITYVATSVVRIVAYSDSDWGANVDNRRSRTGYVILVSGGPVIWQTRSQKTVALSSCEAELYALCDCVKELLWLIHFLEAMNIVFETPILFVDNQGAIALSKNPVNHQRSKHIDIKWFFIRDVLDRKQVNVEYVQSKQNFADKFTKATTNEVHRYLTNKLMPEFALLARVKRSYDRKRLEIKEKIKLQNSKLKSKTADEPYLVKRCKNCCFYKALVNAKDQLWENKCSYCKIITNNAPMCGMCSTEATFDNEIKRWKCPTCNQHKSNRRVRKMPNRYKP